MRGSDERSGSLFSYVGIEGRLRPDHPLRAIRALTDETLAAMESELAALYSRIGRPSIAPQMLLPAMLQAFYSVRSERQLMERMEPAVQRHAASPLRSTSWKPTQTRGSSSGTAPGAPQPSSSVSTDK